jgi:hypothetical protein
MSLDDLRNDLAQVAPAQTDEDLDTFAAELRRLLNESAKPSQPQALDKQALWDRVSEEIDRLGPDPVDEDVFGDESSTGDSPVVRNNDPTNGRPSSDDPSDPA